MEKLDNKQRQKFKSAEKREFKRFAKAARKVGLLVTKESYDRYFREPSKTVAASFRTLPVRPKRVSSDVELHSD